MKDSEILRLLDKAVGLRGGRNFHRKEKHRQGEARGGGMSSKDLSKGPWEPRTRTGRLVRAGTSLVGKSQKQKTTPLGKYSLDIEKANLLQESVLDRKGASQSQNRFRPGRDLESIGFKRKNQQGKLNLQDRQAVRSILDSRTREPAWESSIRTKKGR